MHKRYALRDGVQIECPVKSAITTAGNKDMLAAEILYLAYGVKYRRTFIILNTFKRRTLGCERPPACRNDHDPGFKFRPDIGFQQKTLTLGLEFIHTLLEMK